MRSQILSRGNQAGAEISLPSPVDNLPCRRRRPAIDQAPAQLQPAGGRRFFRMTPLHHHFELIGWSEPQVVMRMWLIGIAAAMVGIALALSV